MTVRIEALNIYPIKSCKGIALSSANLTDTGFAQDRRWMLVNPSGRFLTQRELPRMALVEVALAADSIRLSASDVAPLEVSTRGRHAHQTVTVWRDTLQALDEGDAAAEWCSSFLGMPVRLVRFDPEARRVCNREWTGEVEALNMFSDGYSILLISEASLADLNSRLPTGVGPLPMNRFRPNIVVSGLDAYGEDRIHELRGNGIRLRVVKPCVRCSITTTDQSIGVAKGDEPLRTLKSYRWNAELRGVCFGQNAITIDGVGNALSVGQELEVDWK